MDTQTVAAMQNTAQPGTHPNHNGTTTPSHLVPQDVAAQAAKKTAASLLNPEIPAAPDVQAIQEAARLQAGNKEKTAQRISSRLNPEGKEPQIVASAYSRVTETPAEPIVVSEATVETAPEVQALTDEEDIQVSPEADINPKAEDFKTVRQALKTQKRTAKELLEQKTELEKKVQELTPQIDELPRLKQRVQELEPLEQLLNLKKSDAYNDSYVKPLNELSAKINEIAKDYNVPPEVMDQASKITNRRELNAFLLNNFDEVAALEVKDLIAKGQKLTGELVAAEAKPREALERITQEHIALKNQAELNRRTQISETGKNSWMSALLNVRQTGQYPEFTPRENDPQFNSTWVEPLTKKAAEEYGVLVSHLAQNGLEKLDPEFGKSAASLVVRAVGYDTATARANALERELEEYKANSSRYTSVIRPSVNGGGSSGMGAPAVRPDSPKGAAKSILNSVGVKY